MAANFRFVAHAAKRQTHKFAASGLGDGHSERSFAYARRSDKTKNRTFRILHQPANGEKFENALLDLLETVMIAFENLARVLQIANFLGLLLPRHREQPIEVVARNGGFGRHRRHAFQTLQFRHRLIEGVLGHARGFDLLLQLVELALFAAARVPSGWP